ncbi:MAG: hypothetical protein CME05_03995 [Gemmatimonadaceae bacterium]|nr:hypothetical protein [Gemmatimonadaceae bacterium]
MQRLIYSITGATAGVIYLADLLPYGAAVGMIIGATLGWLTAVLTASENGRFGGLLRKVWPVPRSPRSFGVNPKELEPDEVNYIHEVRRISYHTEIVITVGLLAGLLSIDHGDMEASLWLLSSFLPYYLIEMLCSASFFAIWILRLGILAHLFLRSLWIGLVGLGFAYPSGVNRTRLHGALTSRFYKHLTAPDTAVRLTIRIEHLSSEAYSVWLSGFFSLAMWTIWLVGSHSLATASIYAITYVGTDLGSNAEALARYTALAYAVGLVILWSFLRVTQSEDIARWRQSLLEIFYYYRAVLLPQSRITAVVLSSLPVICLASGMILPDSFSSHGDYTYVERLSPNSSLNSPALRKMRVEEGYLEIFLNQGYLASTGIDIQRPDHLPSSSLFAERISVAIDGTPIAPPQWMITSWSGRPILYSVVPVHHLPPGPHQLNLLDQTPNAPPFSIPFFVLHSEH